MERQRGRKELKNHRSGTARKERERERAKAQQTDQTSQKKGKPTRHHGDVARPPPVSPEPHRDLDEGYETARGAEGPSGDPGKVRASWAPAQHSQGQSAKPQPSTKKEN